MDDTTRTLKVKVKDTWYPAAPLDEGQLVALQLLKTVPPEKILGILGATIGAAFGAETYTALVLRMASRELDVSDLMQGLTNLAKATSDAKEKAAKLAARKAVKGQPAGLDVAGGLPSDGDGS